MPHTSGLTLRVLGCGDAFGSGGRLHTSFHVDAGTMRFLVDCGATTLVALHRQQIDPATLDAVIVSHLHGDHFGGLPFLLLDAAFVSRRTRPLIVAGPPGTQARLRRAAEALFPGFWRSHGRRHLEVVTLRDRRTTTIGGAAVMPFRVQHESGSPAFALRITCAGCTLAYSGDTAWTPALLDAASGSDLFICEATSYEKPIPGHLTYAMVSARRGEFGTRRLMLTHLGPEMLRRADALAIERLREGQRLRIRPAGRLRPTR